MIKFLAPMAGFTNAPTRFIAARFGAEKTYTEMSNAFALARGDEGSWALLETLEEKNVAAHIYGAEPEDFARAAEKIAAENRFTEININAGCPVPKVTRGGAGAALMHAPERIAAIIRATREASGMKVTLKTRLGFTPAAGPTIFDVLCAAENAGAAEIALHARYKSQGHTGTPDRGLLEEVIARAKIPVIANGCTAEGMSAFMIGRAAIGSPWIFQDRTADFDEVRATLAEHLALELAHNKSLVKKFPKYCNKLNPEEATILTFRIHIHRYLAGIHGSSYLRGTLFKITRLDEIFPAVDECLRRARWRKARAETK